MRSRPVVVEAAEVAGVQPAVGVDRLGGGDGIVEVALHDAVAAHQDLAVVGDAHLDAVARQAGGGGDVLERVAGPGQRHGARLGQPVAGHQRLERQLVVHPADQLDRDVGGAGDTGPQRRQLALVGDGQQRVVQRRRAGQHRDPFRLNQLHHPVDVEDRRPAASSRRG